MADPEKIVTELVVALRSVERLMVQRSNELGGQQGWSGVTVELELAEWQSHEGSGSRLGFWGYVDGEKAGVGGVAWLFDLIREGRGWTVERSLTLNANTTSYQETVAELVPVFCADSGDLAHRLVNLVGELLALPAPELPLSSEV
jgi:hypothetical protein